MTGGIYLGLSNEHWDTKPSDGQGGIEGWQLIHSVHIPVSLWSFLGLMVVLP